MSFIFHLSSRCTPYSFLAFLLENGKWKNRTPRNSQILSTTAYPYCTTSNLFLTTHGKAEKAQILKSGEQEQQASASIEQASEASKQEDRERKGERLFARSQVKLLQVSRAHQITSALVLKNFSELSRRLHEHVAQEEQKTAQNRASSCNMN